MNVLYDKIGLNYGSRRRPDPRIAQHLQSALGEARSVLNVGAGTGSYEPAGRKVTAVEPSARMIRQRVVSNAIVVQATAENLPFEDNSFDASMAVLTIHHWSDQEMGVREMRRVTRGKIVFLTYDASFRGFWLADYFPSLVTLDEGQMPRIVDFERWLGPVDVSVVPVPCDCIDGFLAAYWRRPEAYLDEGVRAAMSPFSALGDISDGLEKLKKDLTSGAWAKRYARILKLGELDCGYRLIEAV